VIYLLSLPLGWKSYRDHERNAAAAAAQPAATAEAAAPLSPAPTFSPAPGDTEDDRPARLN
jgi:CDP-diacylglycerol---serine O-phosphatidyltransferase